MIGMGKSFDREPSRKKEHRDRIRPMSFFQERKALVHAEHPGRSDREVLDPLAGPLDNPLSTGFAHFERLARLHFGACMESSPVFRQDDDGQVAFLMGNFGPRTRLALPHRRTGNAEGDMSIRRYRVRFPLRAPVEVRSRDRGLHLASGGFGALIDNVEKTFSAQIAQEDMRRTIASSFAFLDAHRDISPGDRVMLAAKAGLLKGDVLSAGSGLVLDWNSFLAVGDMTRNERVQYRSVRALTRHLDTPVFDPDTARGAPQEGCRKRRKTQSHEMR